MSTFSPLLTSLVSQGLVRRIWQRDPAAFVPTAALEAATPSILNRLGWLTAPGSMHASRSEVDAAIAGVEREGLSDVYLLGMGGSSLCAEVLRDTLGSKHSAARLVVVDTTDESAIGKITDALDPARSCFIVASKSGSTLEVTSLEQHFWHAMAAVVPDPGRHFIAITDPGTSLVEQARARRYRHTFINPADIGGRYSSLSLFGLVPARIAGIDLKAYLDPAVDMATACQADSAENPGLALGAFIGGHAREGRDKLTILASPTLASLGVWIEQLVAESTGKGGRGVLPIVDEPAGAVADYGRDRAFVVITDRPDADMTSTGAALAAAGHPVFTIVTEPARLGAEFFRWEFATAVAGAILERNPFDEPDVRAAKTFTGAQIDAHLAHGAFNTASSPFTTAMGCRRREHLGAPGAPTFVALLDYWPAEPSRRADIDAARRTLRDRTSLAVTHGVGPRYLHSTGQHHKGGPNSGLFLLLTSEDARRTPVPGAAYTFSVLKQAQAFGDFDALAATGRHVVHYHVDDPHADFGAILEAIVAEHS